MSHWFRQARFSHFTELKQTKKSIAGACSKCFRSDLKSVEKICVFKITYKCVCWFGDHKVHNLLDVCSALSPINYSVYFHIL